MCAAAVSWYREFKRLYDCIPCVEVQTLKEHHDQVLHLAFSHRGHRFSSCSKDCTVKVRLPTVRFIKMTTRCIDIFLRISNVYTVFMIYNPADKCVNDRNYLHMAVIITYNLYGYMLNKITSG